MSATITLEYTVSTGHTEGDYAQIFGNGGSGDISWIEPLSAEKLSMFPGSAGNFGWGHLPWGHFRWGHGQSQRTPGWGNLPWGQFPWGHGAVTITNKQTVNECGEYKYAFGCFDEIGNPHEGTPQEVTMHIHIAPPEPPRLKKNDYDKVTGVLILNTA